MAIFQDTGFSGPWYEVGLQLFTHITRTVSNPRGQALVKNSKRPQDFRFSNIHSLTQDPIALDFLNAIFSLFYYTSIAYWSYKYQTNQRTTDVRVKCCSSTDFIIDIALSMILKYHFSSSQPGYKGKYHYSPTQFSVAIGYGTLGVSIAGPLKPIIILSKTTTSLRHIQNGRWRSYDRCFSHDSQLLCRKYLDTEGGRTDIKPSYRHLVNCL